MVSRFPSVSLAKNGQNTDLNHQNIEFGGPLKRLTRTKAEFSQATTDFYVQEYRYITLNTKLGKNLANSYERILRKMQTIFDKKRKHNFLTMLQAKN